jgi:CHAT domain-containing protein/tetratricopeptide (TPR) repeat protein
MSTLLRLIALLWLSISPVSAVGQPSSSLIEEEVSALTEAGKYEEAQALVRTHFDTAVTLKGVDSLEVAAAGDLLVHVLTLNGRGTSDEARSLAGHVLRRKEALLGPNHPDLIPSLLNLSEVLIAGGEFTAAADAAQRAVSWQERYLESQDARRAKPLDRLGEALVGAGRFDDGLAVLNRSLILKESSLPASSVEIARTLEAIGWALQRKGEYGLAGPVVRRAVTLQRQANPQHPAYAYTLYLYGLQLWFEGHLTEAHEASALAVEIAEVALRKDHPMVARALRNLASVVDDLGRLVEGRALLERAFAIAERAFGPVHYEMRAYLNDLAISDLYMGNYTSARELFERALNVAESTLGPRHERTATSINNLALVYSRLGDYPRARREHGRAIAIWERALGRSHPFVARALVDLASVYRDEGLPGGALPLLERALTIQQQRLGRDHRDVALTHAELATILRQLGQRDRAQNHVERAADIWAASGSPEGPEFSGVLSLYGRVQQDLGHPAVARDYYLRALDIQGKVAGRAHPVYAETQAELASVFAALGDHRAALSEAASAEATSRDHRRLTLRYLPERESLAYAAQRPQSFDLIVSLAPLLEGGASSAIDSAIRGRALVTDEMATRQIRQGNDDAEGARLHGELVSAQQRLANLLVRGAGQLDPTRYAASVVQVRREAEDAERRLAGHSAAFREQLEVAQIGVDEVRAALPRETMLVSFVRYERTRWDAVPAPRSTRGRSSVPSYLAFVLVADRPVAAIPLGDAATIEPLITRWRRDIVAEMSRPLTSKLVGSPSRSAGSALRKLIWDPIVPHVTGAKQVLLVADGALHLVPFAALPVGRDGYLLEEAPTIHYLSTERDLVERPRRAATSRSASGLLALGAPAFDGAAPLPQAKAAPSARPAALPPTRALATGCSFQNVRFDHLSGALQEARDIAALWQTQRLEGSARLLTGAEASERAFKQNAPGHRVLHLATHGFFLGPDCSLSLPSQRGIGGLATSSGRTPAAGWRENPLHLSGLALAGANRRARAAPHDEDGVLTAEEVVSLNLDGVEWAVLSACDTGVGVVHAGEGVFGLRRAFQVAGVRTVIMSLWSVDDEAARAWMQALYAGRLRDELSTADAVRAASLAVLRDRRSRGLSAHPFYWAAFVAVGDSR